MGFVGTLESGLPGATGIATMSSDEKAFYRHGYPEDPYHRHYIQVSGLTQKPSLIILRASPSAGDERSAQSVTIYQKNAYAPGRNTICFGLPGEVDYFNDKEAHAMHPAYVDSTGFLLPVNVQEYGGPQYEWVAIYLPY